LSTPSTPSTASAAERFPQDAHAGCDDDDPYGKPSIVISGKKSRTVVHRKPHRREGRGRGKDVDRVVPGVGHEGRTLDAPADPELHQGHEPPEHDRDNQDDDGRGRRRSVRFTNGLQRVPADTDPARNQDDAHDKCGQGLDPSVPVRVVRVSGPDRDDHADENDSRGEDVAGELDAGRDHRGRLRHEADDDVQRREERACGNASQRNASASTGKGIGVGDHASIM
jgi:hypothetical protein